MRSAKTTPVGYALLALVDKEPHSGYELCQIFETTPMSAYSSSPGAIYPALKRLERDGLIAGKTERARSLRPRRIYRSTSAGRAALLAWVSQPIKQDDVAQRLDELLLRFAFMGDLVDQAQSRRFLTDLARLLKAHIAYLQEYLAMMPEDPPNGRLALESGIAQCRAVAVWARRAVREFPPITKRRRA